MKSIFIIIVILMTFTSKIDAQSDTSKIGFFPSKQQLIGVWEMIELPNKDLNQVNPWPLPYQWFRFDSNGKICSFMTSVKKKYSIYELDVLFNTFPKNKTPNYHLLGQFLTIDNPDIDDYQEVWGVNVFSKDVEGVAKKGDLIMTLDDGEGEVIYYRLLRKVEDLKEY